MILNLPHYHEKHPLELKNSSKARHKATREEKVV